MRKLFIVILFIAVVALGGSYIYERYGPTKESSLNENSNLPTSIPKVEYTYQKTSYFAFVTNFESKEENVLSTKLPSEIYATKQDIELSKQIETLRSLKFAEVKDEEDLIKKLKEDKTRIGIQSLDTLSPKLKTLQVDNKFIFDKKLDLSSYPLKLTQNLKSDTKKENESNFDLKRLTKIAHTGSMIPARGVTHSIDTKWKGDYKRLFESTKPLFDSFDFLSSTFESPILGNGKQCESCFSFIGPDSFIEGVKYSGIDFFSMASNHIMDGGVEGLANTQKKLDEINIKYNGASIVNNDDAGKPVLVEINGLKIAYIGLNDTPGFSTWARDNRPGAASISDPSYDENGNLLGYVPNVERIKFFLQRAKDLNPDYIFIIMHWNHQEYKAKPLAYTRTLKDLLLDNGADVILGDHPHWVQEIEFDGDKPVFYSMGNFIFDQMWSIETREGMSVELNYIDKRLVNIRLHPHLLNLYDKGMPELLNPEQKEYQETLERIFEASDL